MRSSAARVQRDDYVELPVPFPDQAELVKKIASNRFVAGRCGRRYGKTKLAAGIAAHKAAYQNELIGWFAPEYKFLAEAYREVDEMLAPVCQSATKDGVYFTRGGGRIDFWSLDNENAGRSRKYHFVVVDEAAFTKPNMKATWERNIRPTLLDYRGGALVISNTNGVDPDNFMYQVCVTKPQGIGHFVEHHAPTHKNPHLPPEELEALIRDTHPLVYQQEYLAEFVDWSGSAFFSLDKLLSGGQPLPWPSKTGGVFAVIDSATKTGKGNDGTGCVYYALDQTDRGHPLRVLDWELLQIEGGSLETWLPGVLKNLQDMARDCHARSGVVGVFIEDAASGMVLLQQAKKRFGNQLVRAIDSKLTSVGKDERAISVSGYVHRGQVKLTQPAFDRTSSFKETTRNHFIGQVTGFRVGDKDNAKRADDLLDCFTYGVALALGDKGGF